MLREADTGGAARYRLLAVVREHGAAHADEADSCAERHRAYYAGRCVAQSAMPGTASSPSPFRPRRPVGRPTAVPGAPGPGPAEPGFAGPPAGTGRVQDVRSPRAGNAAFAGRWALLTAREREVAGLVAKGLTNKDIASRLVVSKRTVDAHLEHILGKLGYSSRLQVAALASHEQDREHSVRHAPRGICREPASVIRREGEQKVPLA